MSSIPGWPPEFVLNRRYGAECDICRNQSIPIGIYKDCEHKHNTCGTCFSKHSWDDEKQMYECPRCVYTRMVEVKKNITKWLEERSFVNAPEIHPGAYKFSQEAAKQRAIREGKDCTDIIKRKSRATERSMTEIESVDDVDETSLVRRSMQKKMPSTTTTLKFEEKGRVVEYVRVKQAVDDCDVCKSALCMDCIWEVTTSSK